MSRSTLAVLVALAFVIMAGCGSGPGIDQTSSGGFAAAIDPLAGFVPLAKYTGADEAVDEAGNELPADVAAASPLKLTLIGGEGKLYDPVSKHWYYPMKVGETRPLVATWTGGAVSDSPVWSMEAGINGPSLINPRSPTLTGNCVAERYEMGRPTWIKVKYGGYIRRIWVWPQAMWPSVGQTAKLNTAGARLKITGSSAQWGWGKSYNFREFWPDPGVSGEMALKGVITPAGSYPGAPAPTWTASQSRLQFVGSATGWTIRFKIRKTGVSWLTAVIRNSAGDDFFAVTVRVSK